MAKRFERVMVSTRSRKRPKEAWEGLARLKDREGALKEFKALREFDPPNRNDLIRRFAILAPAGGQKP
jgi:hypothetical protein